jgi:hypothetical protein
LKAGAGANQHRLFVWLNPRTATALDGRHELRVVVAQAGAESDVRDEKFGAKY